MTPIIALAAALARAGAPEDYGARIQATLDACTIRAALGPLETPVTPALANALLDEPELVAWLARRRKIAPYLIETRDARSFWVDDLDGTQGTAVLVERREDRRVYYGEGTHRSAILRTIQASAVLAMDMRAVEGPGCRPGVRTTFDVCVRLRSRVLAGLVRLVRAFLRQTVARKFSQAFLATHRVAQVLGREPRAAAAEIRSFDRADPARREALARLVEGLEGGPPPCLPGR